MDFRFWLVAVAVNVNKQIMNKQLLKSKQAAHVNKKLSQYKQTAYLNV